MAGKDDLLHRSSGPIQVPVPGLLGFMQLKNRGGNPSQFMDSIQGNFDLLEWYLSAQQLFARGDTANCPSGQTAFVPISSPVNLEVPANEWWYVHDIKCNMSSLAAGDRTSFAPAYSPDGTTTTLMAMVLGEPITIDVVQTVGQLPCAMMDRPRFFGPGCLFGIWFNWLQLAAGNEIVGMTVRYTPLPI